ncbi:MAG TPA: DUF664 domain-containing protein [Candidatus Saccharimonadales bacterium]|nr:DUF664 domain-containing protein [Candidatus Saccharimonadales bacterium]
MLSELRKILLRDLGTLGREVELYPDDAALWKELPGLPNTGGALVLHLCGNLRHFVGAQLGGSGYVRNREAEFALRGVPRARLRELVAAAEREVRPALEGLHAAVLDADFPVPVAGHTLPARLFMLHLCTHLAYHLGQLDYHRRAVSGDSRAADAQSVPALV